MAKLITNGQERRILHLVMLTKVKHLFASKSEALSVYIRVICGNNIFDIGGSAIAENYD
jgi:hypothetical protein